MFALSPSTDVGKHERFGETSRRLAAAALAITLVGGAVGGGLLAAPAMAADPAPVPEPCPDAYPVDELSVGQPLHGLTVERGTEPEPFTATVAGVLNDGIAPGMDMVLIEATSAAIDKYGIWAGMSGSPVYTADGRLVGAVAYGLANGPSPVAGVTPATEMYRLIGKSSPAAALKAAPAPDVDLPQTLSRQLTRSGTLSAAQAEGGMRALPDPIAVSGVSTQRLARQFDWFADLDLSYAYRSSTASFSGADEPAPVAGGNAAAALSYGETTIAATGTVTAVCDDNALLFGHPFFWSGATTQSLHAADALLVQDDMYVSFKVANPLGVQGTVEQDRLAGLHARVGTAPPTTPVRSSVTNAESGFQHVGSSYVVDPEWTADIAAAHFLAAGDRVVDSLGDGHGMLTWVVSGHTSDGFDWKLRRRDAVASDWDLTIETADILYAGIQSLLDAGDTRVFVDNVRATGLLDEEYELLRLKKLLVRNKWGKWRDAATNPIVKAGRERLRVRVVAERLDGRRVVEERAVPSVAKGNWRLVVRGQDGKQDYYPTGPFGSRLESLRRMPAAQNATIAIRKPDRVKNTKVAFDYAVRGVLKGSVRARS
jgi:hypothetical protein